MTNSYTSSTAETSTVGPTGSSEYQLSRRDIGILRWALSASSNLIAAQEGRPLSKKEAVNLIASMSELDEKLVSQYPPEPTDSGYVQLTIF